jgi:hypothetical protein
LDIKENVPVNQRAKRKGKLSPPFNSDGAEDIAKP